MGSRYMKSVIYHALRTVSESCYVIFGLWKYSRTHLTSWGESFLKYFGEKDLYRVPINPVLKYEDVVRWCGGVRELVAQGEPRPKIMWCCSSQTHWYENNNETSPSHRNYTRLVFLELNIYTLSPRNMKRPTSSRPVDTTIIGTPHFI